jgi:hypothetical protein
VGDEVRFPMGATVMAGCQMMGLLDRSSILLDRLMLSLANQLISMLP